MANRGLNDDSAIIELANSSGQGLGTYLGSEPVPITGEVTTTLEFPSSTIDAFHRLRVSDPVTLFDSNFVLGISGSLWETTTVGGGNVAYNAAASESSLTTGVASGDKAVIEQHGYSKYHPGKSTLVIMTGILGASVTNSTKRIGLFNDEDGVFFERDGSTTNVVIRSSASGVLTENRIAQASWNIDKLNGAGPSGITADWTKTMIFVMNYQWLGVGAVTFAVDVGGTLWPVHRAYHSNIESRVYMASGNLPARYEVINSGASAGATLKAICTSIQSEGGVYDSAGIVCGANMGITTRSVTTRQCVLSVRLKTTFKTKTNRMTIIPLNVGIRSSSDVFWELVLQQYHQGEVNLGGSPTWTDVDTNNSGMEYSVNATTLLTTGRPLVSGYTAGGGSRETSIIRELGNKAAFALNAAGTNSDVLNIVATSFSGSAAVSAAMNWREIY